MDAQYVKSMDISLKEVISLTGRDLILYILEHNLENEPVIKNGTFIGFITAGEAASKFHVGIETINLWVKLNMLNGIKIGNEIYILAEAKPKQG